MMTRIEDSARIIGCETEVFDKDAFQLAGAIQPSTQAEMDAALAVLNAHKDAWAGMNIAGCDEKS